MNLAFVLLSKPVMPKDVEVARAYAHFTKGESLRVADTKSDGKLSVATFDLGAYGKAFVALMPVPVPNGEAEAAARFSLSSLGTSWKLPPHQAHLVVTMQSVPGDKALETLQRFTSLLAAVTQVSPAVGVYWGEAHATHDPKFLVAMADNPDPFARLVLWNGVSLANEGAARVSLLSLGMKQLGLPNLLLTAPRTKTGEALPTLFDLLSYLTQRGTPLPEGDTVGPTEQDKWTVHYVASPVDPKEQVWRVELP